MRVQINLTPEDSLNIRSSIHKDRERPWDPFIENGVTDAIIRKSEVEKCIERILYRLGLDLDAFVVVLNENGDQWYFGEASWI